MEMEAPVEMLSLALVLRFSPVNNAAVMLKKQDG
jgi:hypothetical protein